MTRLKLSDDVLAMFKAEGRKGGKARAKRLTKTQRSAIAAKASAARWAKYRASKAS